MMPSGFGGGGYSKAMSLLAGGVALVAAFFTAPVIFRLLESDVRNFAFQHYPGYLTAYVGWALAALIAVTCFAAARMLALFALSTISATLFNRTLD